MSSWQPCNSSILLPLLSIFKWTLDRGEPDKKDDDDAADNSDTMI